MNEFVYDERMLSSCAKIASKKRDRSNEECIDLFQQHQSHYRRHRPNESATLGQDRYYQFIENVIFVNNHNAQTHRHKVVLNQFSDKLQDEIPFYRDTTDGTNTTRIHRTLKDRGHELHANGRDNRKGKRQATYRKARHNQTRDYNLQASVYPISPEGKRGELQYILGDSYPNHANKTREFKSDPREKDWETHLNWADKVNPDGVSLVHPSIDQGDCGSCWAFAATGTLEAIASRHIGFHVYDAMLDQLPKSSVTNPGEYSNAEREAAIEEAQRAESHAIQFINLSIQELIDCDSKYDQGCVGGNPVLAFPFIYKHGLVSSNDYPYTGKQKHCHKKKMKRAIATAESWGVLESENEQNMKHVLRHLGPIAVGLDGSDKAFTHYKSGIFNSIKCSTALNHAMLIVGYGEEETETGVEKYWIARNSWGVEWGMNGFIWIKRNSSIKNIGVCGIAINPNIALGATLINDDDIIKRWEKAQLLQQDHLEQNANAEKPKLEPNPQEAKGAPHSTIRESLDSLQKITSSFKVEAKRQEPMNWRDYTTLVAPFLITIVAFMCIRKRNLNRDRNRYGASNSGVDGDDDGVDEKSSIINTNENMQTYGSAVTA